MDKTKKINLTQIIRHVIQILAFILMPGLFYSVYLAFKNIYVSIVSGSFEWASAAPDIALLLAIIPVTVIWGRFFCGYLCSFGAMGELIYWIASKIRRKNPVIPEQADKILKYVKYVVLAFLFIFVWNLGIAIDSGLNPLNVFGLISRPAELASFKALLSVGGILLLLIMAGSVFIERFFCRYFCPVGAIFSLVSVFRLFKIKRETGKCSGCGACDRKCAMGIKVSGEGKSSGKVRSGECIDCMKCVKTCPYKALSANPNAAVSGTAAALLMTGLYCAGNIVSDKIVSASRNTADYVLKAENENNTETGAVALKDGVYEGTGTGFRGTTKVTVTVSNGKISDIELVSKQDDDRFFDNAWSGVIASILKSQSTDVSTVSGATFSSRGIIEAVSNALNIPYENKNSTEERGGHDHGNDHGFDGGENRPEAPENRDNGSTENTEPSTTEETAGTDSGSGSNSGTASFKDGVYEGTGTGFRGTTKVTVTVANGKITDIELQSKQDDDRFFDNAWSGVIASILKAQSTDVSTVSGATFSSRGIIEAVSNALNIPYENKNSTEERGGHGHGEGHGHSGEGRGHHDR